jgi:glycosyltransferase involved in cell wall biosynthesis
MSYKVEVRQCLQSLEVDQIIVVDDGSTDDMWLEVQRIKEEDNYLPAYHSWKLPRPSGMEW